MQRPDRRDFMLAAVAAPAATVALAHSAGAADEAADALAEAAQALADVVLARHGKFIDEASAKLIQQKVRGQLATGEALKRMPLRNSDEPDFVFAAEVP